jgi:hypothetical protein
MKAIMALFLAILINAPLVFAQPQATFTKASLRGSKASQEKQNIRADRENLSRVRDDAHLEAMKKLHLLVSLLENENLKIDPRLDPAIRFARPWTVRFSLEIGRDFRSAFPNSKSKLQVNSAVRTKEYQKELRKSNKNAAEVEGSRATSHTTGATIDITKLSLEAREKNWMRRYLLKLEARNVIDETEEHKQAVFHIMVFKHYCLQNCGD